MLVTILVAIASFTFGVMLTGAVAFGVIGILYGEAASMVDSYMNATADRAIYPSHRGHAEWKPRIVGGAGW